jgi:hypothetical protein
VLSQGVIRAPFDLTWPALVPDAQFDLDRHITRFALPSPGTADQFDALISEFLSRPPIRTRPLWQLLIIEGLEDGSGAAALKVHHVLPPMANLMWSSVRGPPIPLWLSGHRVVSAAPSVRSSDRFV